MAGTIAVAPQNPTNTTFPYNVLGSSPAQFRLIRILGVEGGRLQCELQTFALHGCSQEWKALSYRWGDDDATEVICLNKQNFLIRPNLHGFLRQMVKDGESGWIFIDAICVNQCDIDERSQQVQLMGSIYRDANEVMVWIPVDIRHPEHRLLEKIDRKLFESVEGDSPEVIKLKNLAREGKQELATFITGDAFWSRLWIVQEVLLATKLTILFADLRWTMRDLALIESGDLESLVYRYATRVFARESNVTSKARASFNVLRAKENHVRSRDIITLKSRRESTSKSDILIPMHKAVSLFCTMSCQLLHDKIFALLGVAATRIVPDYKLPIVDIFIDILCDSMISIMLDTSTSLDSDGWSEDLPILAAGVYEGFRIEATNPLAFLVSRVVCVYLFQESGTKTHQYLVFCDRFELTVDLTAFKRSGKLKIDRKWYETKKTTMARHDKLWKAHWDRANGTLEESQRENSSLVSPWKTYDNMDDVRSCAEWALHVRSRCEALWIRYQEQPISGSMEDDDNTV